VEVIHTVGFYLLFAAILLNLLLFSALFLLGKHRLKRQKEKGKRQK
jgi:hypothetical protein